MYLAAGFSIVREDDEGNVCVRKQLPDWRGQRSA